MSIRPDSLPTVAVVIVNLDGADYLPACMDSLAEQDYPRDLVEVVVVDNGSTDGSRQLLARDYPWARVLPQDENLGFAPAVDTGVRAVGTEHVALLNNDMRVSPDWLTELVRAVDPAGGIPCVGGQILSWDGDTVDFVRAAMNFGAIGYQPGFGRPRGSVAVEDGSDLLFACGGSMLVDRAVYLETGGFDPEFFAYYEDVDFGWRLWVLGYGVRLAAKALSYHRHHGTASRFPEHQRYLLLERNALRCMVKNYEDENLAAVLGPALLLVAKRAVQRGSLDRAPYDIGGGADPTEIVSRTTLAHLHAIADVVDDLPRLLAQRELVQQARRREDAEVVERFGHPFEAAMYDTAYLEAQEKVVTGFSLDHRFERQRVKRVLMVADGTGPGSLSTVRTMEMARSLSDTVEVTLALRDPVDLDIGDVRTEVYIDQAGLRSLAEAADLVLLSGRALGAYRCLVGVPTLLVADLCDPWLYESPEAQDGRRAEDATTLVPGEVFRLMDECDFLICASERQRDYWLGTMAARGRLGQAIYQRDPSLREVIDVVPFGVPARLPLKSQGRSTLHPAICGDDSVVLCVQGPDSISDLSTVVDAFAALVREEPSARLCVLSVGAPGQPGALTDSEVMERAEGSGLAPTTVVFSRLSSPDELEPWLVGADVAVSAPSGAVRGRLASRTHVLDYLWARVPVVATEADALADVVREEGLGVVVSPSDPPAMAAALTRLLRSAELRAASTLGQDGVERYGWQHATAPLRRIVAAPWRWQTWRQARGARIMTEDTRVLMERRMHQVRTCQEELDHRRDEADALRSRLVLTEARLEQLEARWALFRKTPLHPLYQAAQRARKLAKRVPRPGAEEA